MRDEISILAVQSIYMWWIKCQAKEYTAYNDVHSKKYSNSITICCPKLLAPLQGKIFGEGQWACEGWKSFRRVQTQCCHCPVSFEQWVQRRLKWCSRCRLKIWWDKFPIHFWCRALGFICESLGHCQDPYQQSIHGSRSIFVSITVIIAKQGQRFVMLPKSPSNICCLVVVRLKDFVLKWLPFNIFAAFMTSILILWWGWVARAVWANTYLGSPGNNGRYPCQSEVIQCSAFEEEKSS